MWAGARDGSAGGRRLSAGRVLAGVSNDLRKELAVCVYCNCGDHDFHWNPPWHPNDYPKWPPQVPAPNPLTPIVPWGLERLREYEELLRRIKELEDKLGCPCEPNKADYLGLLRQRIEALEKRAAEKGAAPL